MLEKKLMVTFRLPNYYEAMAYLYLSAAGANSSPSKTYPQKQRVINHLLNHYKVGLRTSRKTMEKCIRRWAGFITISREVVLATTLIIIIVTTRIQPLPTPPAFHPHTDCWGWITST